MTNAVLYTIICDLKKVNKDLTGSDIVGSSNNITGSFREPFNTDTPIFMLNIPVGVVGEYYENYNYIEIKFTDNDSRYYFITERTYLSKTLVQLNLKQDVLQSFARIILQQSAFVDRNVNGNSVGKIIVDDQVPLECVRDVEEYEVTYNISPIFTTSFNPYDLTATSCNYVVAVLNDVSYTSDNVLNTYSLLPNVSGKATSKSPTCFYYVMNYAQLYNFAREVMNDIVHLSTYVLSVVAYPFDVRKKPTEIGVTIGSISYPSLRAYELELNTPQYINLRTFRMNQFVRRPSGRLGFMSVEPYTTYELYLPYIGWITLDSNLLGWEDYDVYAVQYVVDYISGSANCFITSYNTLNDDQTKKVVYSSKCQIGNPISLSSTNNFDINNQKNALSQTTSMALLTALYQHKDLKSLISSGVNSLAKEHIANLTIVPSGNVKITDGNMGVYSPYEMRIRITRQNRALDTIFNDSYANVYGFTCCETNTLDQFHGLTIINNLHYRHIQNGSRRLVANKSEVDEIELLFKSGVILP